MNNRIVSTSRAYLAPALLCVLWGCGLEQDPAPLGAASAAQTGTYPLVPGKYVSVVQRFADFILAHGRDENASSFKLVSGQSAPNKVKTPLFFDALAVNPPHAPLRYRISARGIKNGFTKEAVPANFHMGMHLNVVLDELSRLTADTTYQKEAERTADFALSTAKKQGDGSIRGGLIYGPSRLGLWGNHCTYDALYERWIGNASGTAGTLSNPALPIHEMEHNYPDVRFMHKRSPQAVKEYLEAYVRASIQDWKLLKFTRHLSTKASFNPNIWAKTDDIDENLKVPTGSGNSPDYAGYQVLYFAFWHYRLFGEDRAWKLGYQMLKRYMDARDAKTKLGPMSYVKNPSKPKYTNMVDARRHRYPQGVPALLKIAEAVLDRAQDKKKRDLIMSWGLEELEAYGEHVLVPGTGKRWSAVDLDGKKQGSQENVEPSVLWAYALAYRLATTAPRRAMAWGHARQIAKGFGLGDIGDEGGKNPTLELKQYKMQPIGRPDDPHTVGNTNAFVIHAMLELYRATQNKAYLRQAAFQADNLVKETFKNGLFCRQKGALYARLASLTPLALLDLEAAIAGVALQPHSVMPRLIYARPKIIEGQPDSSDNYMYFRKTGKVVDVPGSAPDVPQGFGASSTGGGVKLTWNAVTGATAYRLERVQKGGLPDASYLIDETSTSTLDKTAGAVRYRIRACNPHGCSAYAQAAIDGSDPSPSEAGDTSDFDASPTPETDGGRSTSGESGEDGAGGAAAGGGCAVVGGLRGGLFALAVVVVALLMILLRRRLGRAALVSVVMILALSCALESPKERERTPFDDQAQGGDLGSLADLDAASVDRDGAVPDDQEAPPQHDGEAAKINCDDCKTKGMVCNKDGTKCIQPPGAGTGKAVAFPGAVGFGRNATGGRKANGNIYAVTTTSSSAGTKGSLAWALKQPGPRIIIFKTGGVISATGLTIPSDTTLLGQTAPGDGVALKGTNLSVQGENVIIRGIRIFSGGKGNGLRLSGARNVIIDHSSIAWIANEAFTLWQKTFNSSKMTEDVTLQYTAIYDGLAGGPGHAGCIPGEPHHDNVWNAHGGQWVILRNFTYYRNALVNLDGRSPKINAPSYRIEVVNSIYLPADKAQGKISSHGSGNKGFQYKPNQQLETLINLVENRYKQSGFSVTHCGGFPPNTKLYNDGSVSLSYCVGKHAGKTIPKSSSPTFASQIPASAIAAAQKAEQIVLSHVGPVNRSASGRDKYLEKALDDYKKGKRHFQCPKDLPPLIFAGGAYPTDTDDDGIPNAWEQANGLDAKDKADASSMAPSGYLWIEEYANSLISMPTS